MKGRLLALSRTHNLLNRSCFKGASLRDILMQELAPYASADGRGFTLGGDDFTLEPVMAVTLGMAFHELATNAAKYGALSASGGGWRRVADLPSPVGSTSSGRRSAARRSLHPTGGGAVPPDRKDAPRRLGRGGHA